MRCLLLIILINLLGANVAEYDVYYNVPGSLGQHRFIFYRPVSMSFMYDNLKSTLFIDSKRIETARTFPGKRNYMWLPDANKKLRERDGMFTIDDDCSHACFDDLGLTLGKEFGIVVQHQLARIHIEFYHALLVSGDGVEVVNNLKSYSYNKMLTLDSSRCYTPEYSLNRFYASKIGMPMRCVSRGVVVKAIITLFGSGSDFSYILTLTPLGAGRFKAEVDRDEMSFDFGYEDRDSYAVLDVRWLPTSSYKFGLLLGYRAYMEPFDYNKMTIKTVESQNSVACPVVLLIPDEFENLYQRGCVPVDSPPDKIDPPVKPSNFDNYTFLFSRERDHNVLYRIETVDDRFEFYIATQELRVADYDNFRIKIAGYALDLFDGREDVFHISCTTWSHQQFTTAKVYGTWAGLNLIPVVITRSYIRFGSELCEFIQSAMGFLLPGKIELYHEGYSKFPLFIMPKNYSKDAVDRLESPRSKFGFLPNYHYLQPRLCNGGSTFNISTEGSFFFFFGIPFQCFDQFTIINGTLLDIDFSIYHDKHKLVFIWGKIETNITRTDLQNRLGLVMIPMTLYPEYFYIGGNFVGYDLDESYYQKMASYQVQLGAVTGSCSFMFVVPKNESKLDDSLECIIPPEWALPTPWEDPNEELYWIAGGSALVGSVLIYVLLLCYCLRCCESKRNSDDVARKKKQ